MVVSASAALPLAASSSSVPSTSDKPSSNSNSQVVSVRDATLFNAKNTGQMSALDGRSSQAETANAAQHLLLHSIQIQSPVLLAHPGFGTASVSLRPPSSAYDSIVRRWASSLEAPRIGCPLIGWPQMAQQELGLLFGHADGLRWTATAQRADRPPLLDGTLNDPFWQRANAMELTELDATKQATQATQIRWAYDREYLYVGITSPRPKADIPLPVAERRGYDAELNGVDHVQLTLDTDRDYCTAIELGIAADGRTYDRCCGCADYNPKWHVSVRSQTGQWTAELAIELDALTTQTDLPGKAWAVSARRLQPDGNHQSWSRLRSHAAYLHASGLLLFAGPTQSE